MRSLRWLGNYSFVFVVVLIVRCSLWVSKHQVVRKLLVRACPAEADPAKAPTVQRVAHAVDKVSRFIPDASCLTQAIAGQAILSWKGIPSTISVGVRQTQNKEFKAHAWLLWNSEIPLGGTESSLEEFSKIMSLPTPDAHRKFTA